MLPHICELGDVLRVPILAIIDDNGDKVPCTDVTGHLEYKGKGGGVKTLRWQLTLSPPIRGADWIQTFESKGPVDIEKNHFRAFNLVGPNTNKWSTEVDVLRGGTVRGTVNQLKVEHLGNKAIENEPSAS